MDRDELTAHVVAFAAEGGHGTPDWYQVGLPLETVHQMSHDYRDPLPADHEAALTHSQTDHDNHEGNTP